MEIKHWYKSCGWSSINKEKDYQVQSCSTYRTNKNEGLCADARHLLPVTRFEIACTGLNRKWCSAPPMERDYDIFEVLPDGQPIWRAAVAGHENALRVLKQLAAETTNEVRMMHLPTKALIAMMNADKSQSHRSE